MEIDVTYIAAMLTVIGYAANEVVVVFDRVRENSGLTSGGNPTEIMNQSIKEMFTRSIYTVGIVIIGAGCLYFFGAEPLQMFFLAIFVGLITETFVSLCGSCNMGIPSSIKLADTRLKTRSNNAYLRYRMH